MTPKKGKLDVRKAKGVLPADEYRLHDYDMQDLAATTLDNVKQLYNVYGDLVEERKSRPIDDDQLLFSGLPT